MPQRCNKQGREGRGEKGEEGSLPPLGKGKQKTAAILWYERRAQRCQVEQQSRATLRVARSLIGVRGISKLRNTRPLFDPEPLAAPCAITVIWFDYLTQNRFRDIMSMCEKDRTRTRAQ